MTNLDIKNASHLLTNSESAKDETIRHVGVFEAKITVIYHGIPLFPAANMAHRQSLVLTVGGVKQENMLRKRLLIYRM